MLNCSGVEIEIMIFSSYCHLCVDVDDLNKPWFNLDSIFTNSNSGNAQGISYSMVCH